MRHFMSIFNCYHKLDMLFCDIPNNIAAVPCVNITYKKSKIAELNTNQMQKSQRRSTAHLESTHCTAGKYFI